MYDLWMAQRAGTVAPIPCLRSERYEPYLVVQHCKALPPCQEHFTGYGKNKISVSDHHPFLFCRSLLFSCSYMSLLLP